MPTQVASRGWQRVKNGASEVHMIPDGDIVRHEASVRCFCNPDAEHSKKQKLWVVFHQRIAE